MERRAKVKIGFLVLFIAVLGVAAALVAGQAGPNESAGYTINGDSQWIKYGQEMIGSVHVLERVSDAGIHVQSGISEQIEVQESRGDAMAEQLPDEGSMSTITGMGIGETEQERLLTGADLVSMVKWLIGFLALVAICITTYRIKGMEKR